MIFDEIIFSNLYKWNKIIHNIKDDIFFHDNITHDSMNHDSNHHDITSHHDSIIHDSNNHDNINHDNNNRETINHDNINYDQIKQSPFYIQFQSVIVAQIIVAGLLNEKELGQCYHSVILITLPMAQSDPNK